MRANMKTLPLVFVVLLASPFSASGHEDPDTEEKLNHEDLNDRIDHSRRLIQELEDKVRALEMYIHKVEAQNRLRLEPAAAIDGDA